MFELQVLLLEWGMPIHEVDDYFACYGDEHRHINFDEFFTQMAPIWEFSFAMMLTMQVPNPSEASVSVKTCTA